MTLGNLNNIAQIEEITSESLQQPVGIFKHSTSCSISSAALDRLKRNGQKLEGFVTVYYLDLLAHRNASNTIAKILGVEHESPQFILLKDGKVVYHES